MKDIKGFEGLYAITKDGKVWAYPKLSYFNAGRWKEGRFLKFFLIGNGYQVVCLYKNKKQKKLLVHRLIALTYIPNPLNLKEINHINGNKLDNRVDNLEWTTSKQNKEHAWKNGLYTHKGSNHYLAKLDERKIRKIRKLYKQGINGMKIAKLFNVSFGVIYGILRGEDWSHVI